MTHLPTLTETVSALRAGEVSSTQCVESSLARIAQRNDELGTFIHVDERGALERARRADEQLAAASSDPQAHAALPALLGVPTALKDAHDVAGMPTTMGTLTRRGPDGTFPAATQSDALARTLVAAGAVMLGKTQVPEFLLNGYSENRVFPPARNPYSPAHTPGGSSGGQAAAVASGMLAGAVGSDGGGSIRIPAAACGLIGLKPNRGRVPSHDAMSNVAQAGVSGPITRTARDAALLMDVLCSTPGHAEIRRPVRAVPHASFTRTVDDALRGDTPWGERPLRIGVTTASPFDAKFPITVSPEAREALTRGIQQLEALGHTVEEAQLTYDPDYADTFNTVWATSMGQVPLREGQETELTGLARMFRSDTLRRSAVDLATAFNRVREIEASTLAQYSRYDMILTPALTTPPPRVGWFHEGYDIADPDGAAQDYMRQSQYTPYTSLVNVVGLPAIAFPTVWLEPGSGEYPGVMPMGVQLVGAPSSEAWLLSLTAQVNPPTSPDAA